MSVRLNFKKQDYYSAMNKDEILPFETIGMNLEKIMLSEPQRKMNILY